MNRIRALGLAVRLTWIGLFRRVTDCDRFGHRLRRVEGPCEYRDPETRETLVFEGPLETCTRQFCAHERYLGRLIDDRRR